MSLETSTREVWARITAELVESGMSAQMGSFVAAAGSSAVVLATEIDRLRSDLIKAGIALSD